LKIAIPGIDLPPKINLKDVRISPAYIYRRNGRIPGSDDRTGEILILNTALRRINLVDVQKDRVMKVIIVIADN